MNVTIDNNAVVIESCGQFTEARIIKYYISVGHACFTCIFSKKITVECFCVENYCSVIFLSS